MGFLRINMADDGLALHQSAADPITALRAQAGGRGPVVIMIHGFKFAPGDSRHCPHDHILSPAPDTGCWKALSWPQKLGVDGGDPDRLGIAFGWPARGSIWAAYQRADIAGHRLAQLITMIRQTQPHRPIHLMAHSLGARVALSALPRLPAKAVDRILLLAGAELAPVAASRLSFPAGRTAQVVSITSRENLAYDFLFEHLMPTARARSIGRAAPELANWTTLSIDQTETLRALTTHGFDIAPRQTRICHWSSYLRPGVFTLYRRLIADDRPLPIATLRAMLPDSASQEPAPALSPQPN